MMHPEGRAPIEPEDARPAGSRIVSTPARRHTCAIDYEYAPLSDDDPARSTGATHAIRQVNWNDARGTVRECSECGARWIAVKHPPGSGRMGVRWERVRERRRWWFSLQSRRGNRG